MTISSTTQKLQYACNGSTATFNYTFKIFDDSDLDVIITTAEGVETQLTLTTDYTVTGAGVDAGGTIVLNDPANDAPSGSTLTIIRDVPYTQETDYTEGDDFPAEAHEDALDKLLMQILQLKMMLSRTLLLKVTSGYDDLTLPDPVAGYYLRWKADLSGLENVTAVSVTGSSTTEGEFYKSTMTGDEILVASGARLVCLLDPNGADRNVSCTPSSDYEITIVNTGSYSILFDPSGLAQAVGAGQEMTFYYNITNTTWY
ncbi:MAG: hypothetical protein WDA41_08485 [Candidatus Neomarinimicrobiota bacterium]